VLRDEKTPPPQFRDAVHRLTVLAAVEATRTLPTRSTTVRTPLVETAAKELDVRIGIIPILRAGLSMVDPVLSLIPEAEVWHLGLFRDEQTLEPVTYYSKLPSERPVDVALVLDPMLATGGSAIAALDKLAGWGVQDLRFLGILAAPEGVAAVKAAHPDVPLYVASLDERLNDQGYIVPGLGDAGDRIFGTK
jgi:uracil phosphoribosyltransferase